MVQKPQDGQPDSEEAKTETQHSAVSQTDVSLRPELPDWGVYLRWPEDGNEWIHPEDVTLATQLIPSRRVFKRTKWDSGFYHLLYGEHFLRVRPSMWTQVPGVDLELGQQVELLAQFGKHDPGVFRIEDILYDNEKHRIEFALNRGEIVLESLFSRSDIKPVFVKHHLRVGYYNHQPPKLSREAPTDSLDVGDLTDE
ncbi:MAG: hypothetical protein Aurels2KO_20330 [Aureliella sp.]